MYVLISCFFSIALVSTLAAVTGNPLVFPSLGPTAYLLFFTPLARASSPRHALLGHAIGLVCGYTALFLTGTYSAGPALQVGIHWATVFAAAISLSLTAGAMVLFRVSHPPAGATTLIVSLGLLSKPIDLLIVEAGVLFLVAEAFAINRLAGLPYPVWEDATSAATLPRIRQ